MLRWLIFIVVYLSVDIYVFQAFKTLFRNKWLQIFYGVISIFVFVYVTYQLAIRFDRSMGLTQSTNQAIGVFLVVFIPKVVVLLFMFGEDVIRILQVFFSRLIQGSSSDSTHLPSRRNFVSRIALAIASIPFGALLHGIYKGKYNYKVFNYKLEFDDLPTAFNGYQITHISDIHSGSFDNAKKIKYGIDLINKQASDLIVFTGDLVNNRAEEMLPWITIFKQLKAKDGKYSILGNHDYGDYIAWKDEAAKTKNLEDLKAIHRQLDFDLLLNENRVLEKNNDKITLIGVENWGVGGFKKAGDLEIATKGVNRNTFKILLSHDPSHWEQKVKNNTTHYHLTLSGHTHGMQFGIEIPGWIKWSPVQWKYRYWAGIYKEQGRFLNVNRGFGFLAYPGRVGIWPEITVITLKKKKIV